VLGAAALILALEGSSLPLIAALITLGTVVGGLATTVAMVFGGTSPFGALFDGMATYLGAIVAPWVLTRILFGGLRTPLQELVLDLPLLTGAIRAARNGLLAPDARARPGLSATFFAFVSVTAVFLRLPEIVTAAQLTTLLTPAVALSSLMMVAPLRYPRMAARPALSLAVLALLAAMPFVQTTRLAAVTLVFGLLYAALGHLAANDVTD